ncbi:hypothetical protein [uncultured Bradyrhizobium sp.]|uniref:hypothetical protein n=1 Tax=uncultured Bradyrhizobium sp. TaxID=199684 RepID=UPI0035CA3348
MQISAVIASRRVRFRRSDARLRQSIIPVIAGRDTTGSHISSYAGLTRVCIHLPKSRFEEGMDCRVEPGNDGEMCAYGRSNPAMTMGCVHPEGLDPASHRVRKIDVKIDGCAGQARMTIVRSLAMPEGKDQA